MSKKKRPLKKLALLLGIVIVATALSYLWLRNYRAESVSDHVQLFQDFTRGLEESGLQLAAEVRPEEGGNPFIFILVPQGEGIADSDVSDVLELILFTAETFKARQGFRHEDLDLAFTRPAEHKIVLVRRPAGFPRPFEDYGELSLVSADTGQALSVVNLGVKPKDLGPVFTQAWSVIQAVCLAYTLDQSDQDALCNVMSASGAAGWAGVDAAVAEQTINGYGYTDLTGIGARQDFQYRFIDFIYSAFYEGRR